MSASLHDQIATVILADFDAVSFASGRLRRSVADRLAHAILDLVHDTLFQPQPIPPTPTPIPTPTPAAPAPAPTPSPVDAVPMDPDLPTDVAAELAALCAAAGLTYHDIAWHDNQPVVIASDPEGVREYYTLSVLQARTQPPTDSNRQKAR